MAGISEKFNVNIKTLSEYLYAMKNPLCSSVLKAPEI